MTTQLRPPAVANTRVEKQQLLYDGHSRKAGRSAFKKDLRTRRLRRHWRQWIRDEVLR